MQTEELITELANQQNELEALQTQLMQTTVTKDEENQIFLFDLKDYVDSLSLVTAYADVSQGESRQVEALATILGEQAQTLRALVQELSEQEETDRADFYGQQGGELRRTIASLNGILELNGLLLQENLTFQRKLKNNPPQKSTIQETTSKPSIFQRLFGKSSQ